MVNELKVLDGRAVLVADDEPFNLSIVVRMMRELGCVDLLSAASGTEALVWMDGHRQAPEIALLDFNMPGNNGLQILKQVRTGRLPVPREMRILLLTGSSDFGLVGAAMALDVDAFIIKPVSLLAMAQRLEKVFSTRPDIKDKAEYEKIDVESVSQRLLSRKPVGLAKSKQQTKKGGPSGIPTRLELARPGMILSEEVRSPTGELLLGKATMLNERLIRRLTELKDAIKLDYIYVFPPTGLPVEEA